MWTCNPDLDSRRILDVYAYLQSSRAVIIDLDNQPLFVEDIEMEELPTNDI
jgi:hypothetical protein